MNRLLVEVFFYANGLYTTPTRMVSVESKGEDTAEREVGVGGRELIGCYLQRVSSADHEHKYELVGQKSNSQFCQK